MRDVSRRLAAPARGIRALADAPQLGHFAWCHARGIARISGPITDSRAERRWRAEPDQAAFLAAGVKEQRTAR
jgi:hypothetical protein